MARALPIRWKTALVAGALILGQVPTTASPGTRVTERARIVAALRAGDEGDDAYRFLVGLIEKGMYELAVDQAKAFLRDHPRHEKVVLARYRLATALFELQRFEEAAPHYRALSERDGFEYRAESTFRLGQCELSRERYERANEAFLEVLRLDQEYLRAPATFLLGESAFRSKLFDEAESRYAELLRLDPDSEYAGGAMRGLAWCAWERRDVDETIARIRDYLEDHGGDEEAGEMRILLGEALLEGGRPEEALDAFGSVRSPALADARHRGAGYAYAALDDHERAAREFAALLEEQPDSRYAGEARLLQGIQTLRAGNAAAAVTLLRRAASDDDSEALFWLAQAQDGAGDAEAALATLDRALARKPERELEGKIQIARGDLLSRLGREEQALAAYERGGSDYALYAAAVTRLNAGDPENAIRLVERLRSAHPDSAYVTQAQLVLGQSLFELERYGPAQKAFEALLSSDPEPAQAAEASSRIAWCRYLTGDLDGAAQRFEEIGRRYREEEPAEEALYMLARIRSERGDTEGTLELADTYARLFPQGAHMDEVLLMSGRAASGDAGLKRLERLVSGHPESPLVPLALLELGDRLGDAGRLDQAIARYGELLERYGDGEHAPQARYSLAWCLYRAERFAESARLLAEVGEDEKAGDELRAAAWELCVWARTKAGNPDAAADAWRRFARAGADDARRFESVRTVVAGLRDAGRPGEAQALLDELLRSLRDPSVAIGVLVEGAYLALEEGDVDRADAQVQVARKRAPDDAQVAEASFFVGEARFEHGDGERAAELYGSAAAQTSPVRDKALYKLGFVELEREHPEKAEEAFAALVDGHPESELWGESLFLLGEARFRQERYADAADALQRLLREAPDHEVVPKALFRLGVSLGRLERWEPCETTLSRLAREHPDFPNLAEAELWRGRALAARGNRRPARQAFDRVVALDRGELAAQARLGIGHLLEDEDRVDEALSEYLKVAVLYAHEEPVSEALFRAGACLEALGDPAKARDQYAEVLEKHPQSRFAGPARERLDALQVR